jgi:hypothetical protein
MSGFVKHLISLSGRKHKKFQMKKPISLYLHVFIIIIIIITLCVVHDSMHLDGQLLVREVDLQDGNF